MFVLKLLQVEANEGRKAEIVFVFPWLGTQSIFQLGGFALYIHAQRGFVAAVNNVNLTKT